jgi:hypothetical protein
MESLKYWNLQKENNVQRILKCFKTMLENEDNTFTIYYNTMCLRKKKLMTTAKMKFISCAPKVDVNNSQKGF